MFCTHLCRPQILVYNMTYKNRKQQFNKSISHNMNKLSPIIQSISPVISPVHQSSPAIQSTIQSSPVIIDTTNTNFIRKKPNGAFNSLITYKNNIVSKQVTNVTRGHQSTMSRRVESYNTISSYVNSKLFMVRDSIRRHSALRLQTQNLQERNLSDTMMSDYLHTKTI